MTRLIAFLVVSYISFGLLSFGQPTVSNVRADDILSPSGAHLHSGFRVRWDLNSQACFHRIQAGKTSSYNITIQINSCQTVDLGGPVSGLQAGLTYHYAVQSSFDGAAWSALTTDATYTLAALPSQHPAPPQIAGLWNPTLPNTSGYHPVTIASDCHDLQSAVNAAVLLQPANGTIITIPAGTVCTTPTFPNDPQILSFPEDASHVNTTTGAFTALTVPSGWTLTNGQAVVLNGASCLPGSRTRGNDSNSFNGGTESCTTQGPLTMGVVYYLVGVSGLTFQLSATIGGPPIIPADTGQIGGAFQMEQWPPMNQNWIVIQTSTPDSSFCPRGVRCYGSIWASKMAKFQSQGGCFNCGPNNMGQFTHHLWFRGIDLTHTDVSALANTTPDPNPTNRIFNAPQTWRSTYIVWDRCYLHGLGYPNRVASFFTEMGGAYIAIINSDLEKWDFWRPSISPWRMPTGGATGLSGTLAGQVITLVGPAVARLGPVNTCTASGNITFTITGGSVSSPASKVYLFKDCTATLVMPTGMTGTCTGSMTDSGSVSHPCSVIASAAPAFPLDGVGGYACFQLGTFTLTSGTASGYSDSSQYFQSNYGDSEGTQGWQAGFGPGPFTFANNFLEGTGNLWHMDDGSIIDPQQIWIRQNNFAWDQSHREGSANSDGLRYAQRNGPECKHCRQVKLDGNIFSGWWADVSGTGPAVLFHTASNQGTTGTAGGLGQPGYTVQDIDITNNTFMNGSTAVEVGENPSNSTPYPPAARIRIQNNLFQSINGYTQIDYNAGQAGNGGSTGNPIELDGAIEDLIIDHNTIYDNRGINPQPLWHSQALPIEGCQITNNFIFFNGNSFGLTSESANVFMVTPAIGGTGRALFNSECTNDPNTPGGIMTNNVAVPFWSDQTAPSGLVDPQSVCTTFGGGTISGDNCPGGLLNTVLNHGSAPANLTAIGFTSPTLANFKLLYNSPFVSGAHRTTDGTDVGADINALLKAQGEVTLERVLDIGTTTATPTWFAYDGTVACAVDYAIAPNDPSTQTGGGRLTASAGSSQSVNVTGLTTKTTYKYRVLCPVNQPTGSFTTQ
ncbi:MAG TPA: fibronectin type III domain-containing protein [Bryobacteraceae bacterium]|jgi:hypothetical protein|nr:fibronectin type III domain-containing protein [Bryobacteraceae bacterium]